MGTRVDFYILSTSSEQERQLYACRLAEKALHYGNNPHIYTNNEEQAKTIDDFLWSFNETSFVPHAISLDDKHPVTIGFGDTPNKEHILINISDNMPNISNFTTRIVEILPKEGPATTAGRQRYKLYQQQQFEINTHKIGTKT